MTSAADKHNIHDHEYILNPSPFPYKATFTIKCFFLALFSLGLAAYAFVTIQRRHSLRQSLENIQMAAVKLSPSQLPDSEIFDPLINTSSKLSTHINGWTLLNLWATWCPPCRDEMPKLELLQQKLLGKLNIVAVSADDTVDAVTNFIAINKPTFKILWDKEKTLSAMLGVAKYPESFLIAPNGQLHTQFSGPRDWGSLQTVNYFLNLMK